MFNIYTSNCAEQLAEKLAERLNGQSLSWTDKEVIVVQSKGMERWLNLRLAQLNGVVANISYPFPKSFVVDVLQRYGLLSEAGSLSREAMSWRIYGLLPELEARDSFSVIRHYVDAPDMELRRYQLAVQLAAIFDNYLIHRTDMLSFWSGETPFCRESYWTTYPWQIELWQSMFAGEEQLFAKALRQFLDGPIDLSGLDLPQEIHLFGFPTLAPIMLQFYQALAATGITVNLYYLSPCRDYWADTVTERTALMKTLQGDTDYWETGNPLLASMGTLGREFLANIIEIAGDYYDGDFEEVERFAGGVLGTVQRDVVEFVKPEASEAPVYSPDDRSLVINSCHSPMREVELLYDHILDFLKGDPELQPRDILVMAPNISEYAPYIRAVFENPESESKRLPFTVADGSLIEESHVARIFFNLLKMVNSRFTSREVIELLENEVVYKRFGFKADQLSTIRELIMRARICWGLDGRFRRELTGEQFEENSWHFGFSRLLMGYAMPESAYESGTVFPCDVEGNDAVLTGRLISFVEALVDFVEKLKAVEVRSADEWVEFLHSVLDNFFIRNRDTDTEVLEMRKTVSQLSEVVEQGRCDRLIPLPVVTAWLSTAVRDETAGFGFLQRGITFCKLLPMRSIPSKVICVLGLNDGDFPRQDRRLSFDLMKLSPKPGDRSIRKDDRYLFLEAILSARSTLYLSYIGRSLKDNEEVPPSVLITELLDYIDLRYCAPVSSLIVHHHFLQAFDVSYYKADSPFFSYSKENLNAAKRLLRRDEQKGAPFAGAEGTSGSVSNVIELDELLRFFKNPSEYYLQNHLRVNLKLYEEVLPDDTERFEKTAGLVGYAMRNEILEQLIREEADEQTLSKRLYNRFRLKGELPVGAVGKQAFQDYFTDALRFFEVLTQTIDSSRKEPASALDLTLGELTLTGQLRHLYWSSEGLKQVLYHNGSVSRARDLEVFIQHLAANAAGLNLTTSFVYGKGEKVYTTVYDAVDSKDAGDRLVDFMALFKAYQTRPMPFFPGISWEYWEQYRQGEAVDCMAKALARASEKWYADTAFGFSERRDVSVAKCFGMAFPGESITYSAEFCEVAERVYDGVINERIK